MATAVCPVQINHLPRYAISIRTRGPFTWKCKKKKALNWLYGRSYKAPTIRGFISSKVEGVYLSTILWSRVGQHLGGALNLLWTSTRRGSFSLSHFRWFLWVLCIGQSWGDSLTEEEPPKVLWKLHPYLLLKKPDVISAIEMGTQQKAKPLN